MHLTGKFNYDMSDEAHYGTREYRIHATAHPESVPKINTITLLCIAYQYLRLKSNYMQKQCLNVMKITQMINFING